MQKVNVHDYAWRQARLKLKQHVVEQVGREVGEHLFLSVWRNNWLTIGQMVWIKFVSHTNYYQSPIFQLHIVDWEELNVWRKFWKENQDPRWFRILTAIKKVFKK